MSADHIEKNSSTTNPRMIHSMATSKGSGGRISNVSDVSSWGLQCARIPDIVQAMKKATLTLMVPESLELDPIELLQDMLAEFHYANKETMGEETLFRIKYEIEAVTK